MFAVAAVLPHVMMALGLNIVVGFAGLLDLGYVAICATAAHFGSAFWGIHFNFLIILVLAIVATTIAGVLIEMPGCACAVTVGIVTLACGEIIAEVVSNGREIESSAARRPADPVASPPSTGSTGRSSSPPAGSTCALGTDRQQLSVAQGPPRGSERGGAGLRRVGGLGRHLRLLLVVVTLVRPQGLVPKPARR